MGPGKHMKRMFPGEYFPNVQFKPRSRSYQVEIKVSGAVLLNRALSNTRLIIGSFKSVTVASLASNFSICMMAMIKKAVKERLAGVERKGARMSKGHAFIRVPHIIGSAKNPFDWYKEHIQWHAGPHAVASFDAWVRQIVDDALRDMNGNLRANSEVKSLANRYLEAIMNDSNWEVYKDPDFWRNKVNDYMAKGIFDEPQPMGKRKDKTDDLDEVYRFSPHITAIGGGPNMMPLVYHKYISGATTRLPCFFNKNFTIFSKSVKSLDKIKGGGHPKWVKSFSFQNEIQSLTRLPICIYKDRNYYGGTFGVDYLKDGIKVKEWANMQPHQHLYSETLDFNSTLDFDHDLQPYRLSNDDYDMNVGGSQVNENQEGGTLRNFGNLDLLKTANLDTRDSSENFEDDFQRNIIEHTIQDEEMKDDDEEDVESGESDSHSDLGSGRSGNDSGSGSGSGSDGDNDNENSEDEDDDLWRNEIEHTIDDHEEDDDSKDDEEDDEAKESHTY